jgi:hypothetical protein
MQKCKQPTYTLVYLFLVCATAILITYFGYKTLKLPNVEGNKEVWSAIVALLGALFVAFFAWFGVLKSNYGAVVAKSRIEWIQELRKEFSELLSILDGEVLEQAALQEAKKLIVSIRLRLNPRSEQDSSIIAKLTDIQNRLSDPKFRFFSREELIELIQKQLKAEWERVKREAGHPSIVMDSEYKG